MKDSTPTKTGQTISYVPGDDGDWESGVEWQNPRFTDQGDTVIDNLTGLMWTKQAELCIGSAPWADAFNCPAFANASLLYGYNDWRIPSANEIHSLLDYSQASPALPAGHPFQDVGGPTDLAFWTSTTSAYNSTDAFVCSVNKDHNLVARSKTNYYRVWIVRGRGGGTSTTTTSIPSYCSGELCEIDDCCCYNVQIDLKECAPVGACLNFEYADCVPFD